MAERTVTYNFRGNFTNLAGGLTAMGRGVGDLGVKLTALDRNSVKMRRGLDQLGSAGGKFGIVAAAGFALVTAAAANFEQAMSNVSAATHETAGNMQLLRAAAIEAGQATKFSATEAAAAIEELAKAGVSTTDILDGGLSGALDLAAAGGLEVADAASIAATALTQFRLAGEDVPHVADLLAAGAGKAQGDVSDLSMALKQSGLVASQMGISIEETTGSLAAFASAGLLGSDAGTSFRTMLLRLANPTEESANLMASLGIAAYDAQGQFVGMTSIAGQLQTAFEGKTQAERDSALATIFGSDAIRAANVLYNQGAQGIANWTTKVNDQGYAAETASIKMDNLKGDLEQLTGSLETALIGSGGGSQGPLRDLTQGATEAVNAFNGLPSSAQSATTALLGITAVTGGGLWFGSKVIGGVVNAKQSLADLGLEAGKTRGALANIGTAAVGIAAVVTSLDLMQAAFEKVADTRIETGGLNRDLEALADGRITNNLDNLFQTFQDIDDGWEAKANPLSWISSWDPSGFEAAESNIKAIDEALAGMVEGGHSDMAASALANMASAAEKAGLDTEELTRLFPDYQTALDNTATSATAAAGANEQYAAGTAAVGDEAAGAAEDLSKLIEGMRAQHDAAVAAFDAETQYRQALKDAREQADKNSAGIRGNSDAALENRTALGQLASAWNNQSDAVKNNGERFRGARSDFIKTAEAMGVPREQARALARELLQIPEKRVTAVSVSGGQAAFEDLARIKRQVMEIPRKWRTDYYVNQVNSISKGRPGAGGTDRDPTTPYAGGGYTGRGGKFEPAGIVHRGEVVIPQELVRRDWSMLNSRYGHLPGFAGGGMAGGGTAGRIRSARAGFDLGGVTSGSEARSELHAFAEAVRDAGHQLGRSFDFLGKRAVSLARDYDEESKHLDDLKSKREEIRSGAEGSFNNDIFSGGLSDLQLQLSADTNDANKMTAALQAAGGKGLDGELAAQLAASGNLLLAQQIGNLSAKQIDDLERRFGGRATAQQGLGQAAVDVSGINQSIRHSARVLEKFEKRLNGIEDRIEDAVYKGSRDGTAQHKQRQDRNTANRQRAGGR